MNTAACVRLKYGINTKPSARFAERLNDVSHCNRAHVVAVVEVLRRKRFWPDLEEHSSALSPVLEKIGTCCRRGPIQLGCVAVLARSTNISVSYNFLHDGENLIDRMIDLDFESVPPLLIRASLR